MRPVVAVLIASDKPSSRVSSDNGTGVVSEEAPGTVMKSQFAPPRMAGRRLPDPEGRMRPQETCPLFRPFLSAILFRRPAPRPPDGSRPLSTTPPRQEARGLGGCRAVPGKARGVWERRASRAPFAFSSGVGEVAVRRARSGATPTFAQRGAAVATRARSYFVAFLVL